MRSEKQLMTERIELSNQEKIERSEKKKLSNTWEYWMRTPSNKRRWKKVSQKKKKLLQTKVYDRNLIKGIKT